MRKPRESTSVEQVELGSIMELSVSGDALRWVRQSKRSGGASRSIANGWNLKKSRGHFTVAKPMHEMIKLSLLSCDDRERDEDTRYPTVHHAQIWLTSTKTKFKKEVWLSLCGTKESPPGFRNVTPGSRNANRGPQFHEKTTKREEKTKFATGGGKKRAKFWAVLQRRVTAEGWSREGRSNGGPSAAQAILKKLIFQRWSK